MSSEETIEGLKKQFLKEKKKIIYLYSFVSIVALLALLYGFFQQTKANRARIESEMQLFEYKARAEKAEKELLDLKNVLEEGKATPQKAEISQKSTVKK